MQANTTRYSTVQRCGHFRLTWFLAIFSFLAPALYAQTPVIDGNPAEWPAILMNAANTKKGFKHDPFQVNGVDDGWTQGTQDDDLSIPNEWRWVFGNSNDKGDIANAGAVLINGVLYFFGDRASFSGNSQIAFWFFKDNVAPVGAGSNPGTGFSGEHQNGDLLIISNFTNGGGNADPIVYQWMNKTANSLGGLVQVSLSDANAALATNSQTYPVPGWTINPNGTVTGANITISTGQVWSFTPKSGAANTYPAPLFFEGSVNLAAIPGLSQCFQRFLLETRSSQTLGAALQDLTSNTFTSTVPVSVAAVSAGGTNGPVSLGSVPPHYSLSSLVDGQANNPNYDYSWVQDPPTGGSLSSTIIPNPTFTATTAGTYTFTLTATEKVGAGQQGCVNSASVTRVITAVASCPDVPVAPVCGNTTHTYMADVGPAAYETWVWSVNNGATINPVPANGGQSISVTAGTQNFTLKLTKSYANTSLPNQVCEYQISINPPEPAPDVTYLPPACTTSVFRVRVNNPVVGSTYTLVQLNGNTVVIGPYVSGDLIFNNLVIGQGYHVSSVSAAGCASLPNECGDFTEERRAAPQTIELAPAAAIPSVIAAPNPFNDRIRFSVKSPVTGRGSLELYNMLGQKVKTIYQGVFDKNMAQTFEYNVPFTQRANLIYVFRIGDQQVSGKLLGLK